MCADRNRKKKKRKKKRYQYRCLMFLCAFLLVGALVYICIYYVKQMRAEQSYGEMQAVFDVPVVRNVQDEMAKMEEKEEESDGDLEQITIDLSIRKVNQIDFEALWKSNKDIYAWIEIPGTLVNYPVLQHPTDDGYYLNHTVEKAEGLPGSIYSESVHAKDFSSINTVLYGHNMRNDSMFGSLHDYEDRTFFEENPYVYIYLPERTLVYEIFAASKFSDAYLPTYCLYDQEKSFDSFIEEIKDCAVCVNEEMDVPFGSRILTLSTCIGNDAAHRFLVEAVLIDEYEK